MRQHIICGLKKEYVPFITSVQGWEYQPSLEEFENLISSQESLASQMIDVSKKKGKGTALFTGNKKFFKEKKKGDGDKQKKDSYSSSWK